MNGRVENGRWHSGAVSGELVCDQACAGGLVDGGWLLVGFLDGWEAFRGDGAKGASRGKAQANVFVLQVLLNFRYEGPGDWTERGEVLKC